MKWFLTLLVACAVLAAVLHVRQSPLLVTNEPAEAKNILPQPVAALEMVRRLDTPPASSGTTASRTAVAAVPPPLSFPASVHAPVGPPLATVGHAAPPPRTAATSTRGATTATITAKSSTSASSGPSAPAGPPCSTASRG